MRSGILAGGNWIVDHVKLIDAWPPQDALARIFRDSRHNGGGPYNLLKDLAQMRAPFPLEAAGLLGDDDYGRWILADCRAAGIDTRQLQTTPAAATSYTDVMTVRDTGRRTFFHQSGANAKLAPAHFDFTRTNAKIFYLGYALLLDTLDACAEDNPREPRAADVFRRARSAGLHTTLDCVSENSTRFKTIVTPLLPHVDFLLANDFEAEKLTSIELGRGETLDRASVARAARALIDLGVRQWTVLHFPEGACACSRAGEIIWQPSVKVPPTDVAGSNGAGDALAAGLLFGLHEGWPMQRALELGACAAAASLYHPSCSEAVKPADECLALGRKLGFRN